MTTTPHSAVRTWDSRCGYMMIEALVYISLLFVVLGAGYLALDRCIDNSFVLHKNADDIASALQVGERWRADIRAADKQVRLESGAGEQVLQLEGARGAVTYRFSDGALFRRVASGPWSCLLSNVRASLMQSDPRQNIIAWKWELELQPRAKASAKPGRVRPLFTFISVPKGGSAK
jgi:hypothetical protein